MGLEAGTAEVALEVLPVPRARLPVVRRVRVERPRGEIESERAGESFGERPIRLAQRLERLRVLGKVRQEAPQTRVARRVEASVAFRRGVDDVGEIDEEVARHREGRARLEPDGGRGLLPDGRERATVHHRDERAQPRLIVVLGAVEREDRVAQVRLQQGRRLDLPVVEKRDERLGALRVAAQEFDARGVAAGAGVEPQHRLLAPGEGTVQHGHVADDEGEEDKAGKRLGDREEASDAQRGGDVAVAQGEEGGAGKVEVAPEAPALARRREGASDSPLHECESQDHQRRP